MTEYKIISLADMLSELEESEVKDKLSSFSSPKNKDVEGFLKSNAIQFARQNLAPTNLVYANCDRGIFLCGYFTLTIKAIEVEKRLVGINTFNKPKKFGTYDKDCKKCSIPAPLIAQLGKNYAHKCNELIDGAVLLQMACEEVKKAQSIIGGKVVYLECEDTEKLTSFYSKNGFKEFARRPLDSDEQSSFNEQYLVQMLKYLK